MSSYIPSADGKFDEFVEHLVAVVGKDPAEFYLSEDIVKDLEEELSVWKREYNELTGYRDSARAAVARKDESRKKMEQLVRTAAGKIQADFRISNAARKDAGLPVHKSHKTPIPAPGTAPAGRIELVRRLEQLLYFFDDDKRNKTARPAGAIGVQIYQHIGDDIPTDLSAYKFVGTSSKAPRLFTFTSEQGAQTASYVMRWINHKGETGPFCDPISATIPAV